MKITDMLSRVPIPSYMQDLAKDERGFPIAEFAQIIDGKPDLNVLDARKCLDMALTRRCAICGKTMEGLFAFVGGPLSVLQMAFGDGPMHPECATYAIQVCPFLAMPSYRYRDHTHKSSDGLKVIDHPLVVNDRPKVNAVVYSTAYNVNQQSGSALYLCVPPSSIYRRQGELESYLTSSFVIWYSQGVKTEDEDLVRSSLREAVQRIKVYRESC